MWTFFSRGWDIPSCVSGNKTWCFKQDLRVSPALFVAAKADPYPDMNLNLTRSQTERCTKIQLKLNLKKFKASTYPWFVETYTGNINSTDWVLA